MTSPNLPAFTFDKEPGPGLKRNEHFDPTLPCDPGKSQYGGRVQLRDGWMIHEFIPEGDVIISEA